MSTPPKVVFDCNVYFQATISEFGPANRCVRKAVQRTADLYCSEYTIAEFRIVCSRSDLRSRFSITDTGVDAMVSLIREYATLVHHVPHQYDVRSDPKDSHYVDLALAAQAHLIVSRDRDLLRLRETTNTEGAEFVRRFPGLDIIEPPELLRRLAERDDG